MVATEANCASTDPVTPDTEDDRRASTFRELGTELEAGIRLSGRYHAGSDE